MNALEKLKLAREASAQRALAEQATGMEKLKAARAFKAALAKLGITANKPAAEPATPAEIAAVDLPELVRKLRDGELSTASAQVMSSAIMEAEPYLSIVVCSDRAEEWLEKNPELVRN